MQVAAVEAVFRYLVKFNREESDYLRAHDFLHPASSPETEMWMTEFDISIMRQQFPKLRKAIDKVLSEVQQAKEKMRKKVKA